MNPTNAPLAGMKVLEFTHVASGPFTGQLLADLGADVVKVEPPPVIKCVNGLPS